MMKIALAQMGVAQGDFEKNLQKTRELASRAKSNDADLAVFPEMFLSGFNYRKNLEFLKNRGDFLAREVSKIAEETGIAICGSLPYLEESEDRPRNRMIFASSKGEILAHYDKTHLFRIFNEEKYVKKGDKISVCDTPFGRAGFAICYDLRFPELFIKLAKLGAKFVIISAAFPHPRMGHWRVLCRARAIENQCFVIAVNQGGSERFGENTVKYFGRSAAIDPWGEVLAECSEDGVDELAYAEINLDEADDIRAKIPAWDDRREDIY